MPPQKRKRQTRLTLEAGAGAGAASSSSGQPHREPAKVRYTNAPAPPTRASPLKPVSLKRRGGTQTTIGEPGSAAGGDKSRASFMPRLSQRAKITAESSDEEAASEGAVERNNSSTDEDELPAIADLSAIRSSQSETGRPRQTVLTDDDDDDDSDQDGDEDVVVPSSARRRKPPAVPLDSDSDDDLVILSPVKRRKQNHPRAQPASASSDSDEQPNPKSARRLRAGRASQQPPSSPSKRHQGHRTEKQKKMELLRRRRAGEKIEQLTSSESDDDDDRRGIYDTDSEREGFQALKVFHDDEEEEEEAPAPQPPSKKSKKSEEKEKKKKAKEKEKEKKKKKKKKKTKSKKSRHAESSDEQDSGDGKESDLDSFIDSDDDGPLGAPDLAIPLEFTAQAHLPLKDQFPYVVEWLVHNRINPAFERNDPVYQNAWRKLNDEYHGLASSKFSSAAWKPAFARTLRARPTIDPYKMDAGDDGKFQSCEACGRSGHPASWRIVFKGTPYNRDTLQEIEPDSDSSDDSDSDKASIDSQGNSLPKTSKEWVVGSTCKSNAETAHVLLHWKHALKEWVEDNLEQGGWMAPAKLKEREKLKPKKRFKLANSIVDKWRSDSIISALYGDFKGNLEDARNKTTRGNGRWQ